MRIKVVPTELSRENVFASIGCREGSPAYSQIMETYDQLLPRFMEAAQPVCCLRFVKGEEVLPLLPEPTDYRPPENLAAVLLTVGDKASNLSGALFEQGEYVAGMLADAMADEYLMQMDNLLAPYLKRQCGNRGVGVARRLEAPYTCPMETQQALWQLLCQDIPVKITSGWMFDPVKTLGYFLELTQDVSVFHSQHNCRLCGALDCPRRHLEPVELTVRWGDTVKQVSCREETLLNVLRREGFSLSAPCGGKGQCGKCQVRFLEGAPPAQESDKRFFSPAQLEAGWRLACTCRPIQDGTLLLPMQEEGFSVLTSFGEEQAPAATVRQDDMVLAVDIGTTTLAFALADRATGAILRTHAAVNPQRVYGADVISRIEASVQGKREELRDLIRQALGEGIEKLWKESPGCRVGKVGIAGNTAMIHLLMGYPCNQLGVAPFTPYSLETVETSVAQLFPDLATGKGGVDPQMPVVILPGVSAFVGGDIGAGLLYTQFDRLDAPAFFLDLGTNGEMALWTPQGIYVTSTAAGPAFEGGRISCGTGSIPGAICGVEWTEKGLSLETIGGEPPVGLCGTGVVELTCALLRREFLDETGRLCDTYAQEGFPLGRGADGSPFAFTQKDVRELQLAKSAIRAGAQTLLKKSGVTGEQVAKAWLAGGFGYHLDPEKAMGIGLLPPELRGKTQAPGNTSLGGVLAYLCWEDAPGRLASIVSRCREVMLSADPDFNEFYMEHMFFQEDPC